MTHRLFLLIALSAFGILGCSDKSEQDDKTRHTSALCVTFVDQAVKDYAMQWWDSNHDQCIDRVEANAVGNIPAHAFAGNTEIQSLDDLNSFPNLRTIGDGAFSGCIHLVTANVSHVTTIGSSAFAGCTGLTTVNAPNAVNVGDAAFSGCTNLDTANIPAQSPPILQCREGVRKCSDTGLQSMVCANGKWTLLDNCPKGCKDSVCITDSPIPECTDGALKCSDSGAISIVCQTGHWSYKESCAHGCSDGICHAAPPVICPDKCKENCNANGLCNDIVTPACPSSCKNGCDDFGSCKPDEVTCPSSCKNGCDDYGNCKPDEVTCPSSCKNGCDDFGNCIPDEPTCPSSCKNGCDDFGNCIPDKPTCPSSCKNGCDDYGYCKPDEVTCPSSCQTHCDSKGRCMCWVSCFNGGCDETGKKCKCPSSCEYGCNEYEGVCIYKPDESKCSDLCPFGCDDKGYCKPGDAACPSDCQNGCYAKGGCRTDEIICPFWCESGCDDRGFCLPAKETCVTDINENGECKCLNMCKHGCKPNGECLCPDSCEYGCTPDGSCAKKCFENPPVGTWFDCMNCIDLPETKIDRTNGSNHWNDFNYSTVECYIDDNNALYAYSLPKCNNYGACFSETPLPGEICLYDNDNPGQRCKTPFDFAYEAHWCDENGYSHIIKSFCDNDEYTLQQYGMNYFTCKFYFKDEAMCCNYFGKGSTDCVHDLCENRCRYGCDELGNCKDAPPCPDTCENGCDDYGNCKPPCPADCEEGCYYLSTSCKNTICEDGCMMDGSCMNWIDQEEDWNVYHFKKTKWKIPKEDTFFSYPAISGFTLAHHIGMYQDWAWDHFSCSNMTCTIDWGDGSTPSQVRHKTSDWTIYDCVLEGNTHRYKEPGTYIITTDCPFHFSYRANCSCPSWPNENPCECKAKDNMCRGLDRLIEIIE